VVAVGELVKDSPMEEPKDSMIAEFRMDEPIALATFAVGPYEVHKDVAEQKDGSPLPLEFYSLPGGRAVIKEDFILAEMNNSVRFFQQIHSADILITSSEASIIRSLRPGFPTTIMIPAADRASYRTYSFIAHETSHQWWGDIVLWRSYHDQWLSEGFV
jgi:aminopeptidase N